MNTMGLIAGLRDLRTRLIAVSLIVCILAMQFPLSALARPAENRCAKDPQNQNDQIETCCGHTLDFSMAYDGRTDEDSPGSEPCRPNSCDHCALPCCGTEPLAPFLSEVIAAHAVVIPVVFPADGAPLLSDPTKIFHPPRV